MESAPPVFQNTDTPGSQAGAFLPAPEDQILDEKITHDDLIDAWGTGVVHGHQKAIQQQGAYIRAQTRFAEQNIEHFKSTIQAVIGVINEEYDDKQVVTRIVVSYRDNPSFQCLFFIDRPFFFSEASNDLINLINDSLVFAEKNLNLEIHSSFAVEAGQPNVNALVADGYTHYWKYNKGLE